MTSILDRYASAICSSDMKSKAETVWADADVIGAAGLAARRHDLAMALQRLFSGDNHAAGPLVELLAEAAWGKAFKFKVKLRRTEAVDMAQAVLAWHRDGRCRRCRGHGFMIMRSAPVIGSEQCRVCKGSGRIPFEKQFPPALRELAQWLIVEVEREQGVAGPEAMKALVPLFDL